MNFYVSLINDTLEYIEENINERLSLEDISRRFCLSEFHFDRIFKTVVGRPLKQYVLGRKLTLALERLSGSDEAVIDIAYDFGFEYPEVFSRAFKKQFGISPGTCREKKVSGTLVNKASVIERDIINYKGTLTLKGTCSYFDKLYLEGLYVEVDANSKEFEQKLRATCDVFLKESEKVSWLNHEKLYTVVNCHGEDNGEYTVFYGMKANNYNDKPTLQVRIIPEGYYASFLYKGSMFDIRETFIDDLYKWIMVQEIELNPNGIGMVNIFDKNHLENGEVEILVPIKNPK